VQQVVIQRGLIDLSEVTVRRDSSVLTFFSLHSKNNVGGSQKEMV
jgi:hypothetical protein